MAALRLAMMVECTCRKRLRSLLTRHRSLSEDALAALMSKLELNHVAASCPMPPRVLAVHVIKSQFLASHAAALALLFVASA